MVYQRKIIWDDTAKAAFKEQISYIRKDSIQNAENVRKEVLVKVKTIVANPECYTPDKYKTNNADNHYRAFELHRLRISYFVSENEIRIVRVRHTSQKPSEY